MAAWDVRQAADVAQARRLEQEAILICYRCGRICDKNEHGLCIDCMFELARINENAHLKWLLKQALEHVPLRFMDLRGKIKQVLN